VLRIIAGEKTQDIAFGDWNDAKAPFSFVIAANPAAFRARYHTRLADVEVLAQSDPIAPPALRGSWVVKVRKPEPLPHRTAHDECQYLHVSANRHHANVCNDSGQGNLFK